jgi:hypothetical protein
MNYSQRGVLDFILQKIMNHDFVSFKCYLNVVTNEKGEAVGEVVTILC